MGTLAVWINVRLIRQGKRIINQQERRKERRKRRAKKQSIIQLGPLRTSITQKKNIYKYIYLYSFKFLKIEEFIYFAWKLVKHVREYLGHLGHLGHSPFHPSQRSRIVITRKRCRKIVPPRDLSPLTFHWLIDGHSSLEDFASVFFVSPPASTFRWIKKTQHYWNVSPPPLPPATFSIKLSSKPGWCGVMETRFFKEHSSGHFEGDLRQS